MNTAFRLLAILTVASPVAPPSAAQSAAESLATRPLVTREALVELLQRLDANTDLSAQVRARLTAGDFQSGDHVLLEVQGEPALSDTFAVNSSLELILPPPTVGVLSLKGVLRSELEDTLAAYLTRFLQNPVVRARPLLRLSVQGEVARAGVYGVPADAKLGDALMAAGGTTQRADMRKVRIERNGERVWAGTSLEVPINDVGLQNGDQITVGGRRGGGEGGLRSLWMLVSIAGGLYGISRAF